MQTTIPALDTFVALLKERLEKRRTEIGLTYFDSYKVWAEETPKYFKVYSTELKNGQPFNRDIQKGGDIRAFIVKENGDILKPASWKVPAKHSRGNIYSAENGMEAVSPNGFIKYLR